MNATIDQKPAWAEADRLAALRAYDVLDTPREAAFDDIVNLIARVFDAPIAVVNLIDEGRQWFKAETGLGVRETPLETSFCAHAILLQDRMVVPDATLDDRFACNPLVTGEPHLRFYAGELLKSAEGLPIGTLCVLDDKSRPEGPTPLQMETLQVLAAQVMNQLELRRALSWQRESEARFRAVASTEIDDLRRSDQAKDLLSQELSHRIKNIFAVVSALIALSARQHPEAKDFAGAVRTRINALARAHEFVRPHTESSRPTVGSMTLHAFLTDLFKPYSELSGQARVALTGDDAVFDDQAATPVALLFHELATNAAKYGALSRDGGRVTLDTRRTDDRFVLTWTEIGGPLLDGPPVRTGFGSSLAALSVEGQLDGRLEQKWLSHGLQVIADLPATALSRRRAAQGAK